MKHNSKMHVVVSKQLLCFRPAKSIKKYSFSLHLIAQGVRAVLWSAHVLVGSQAGGLSFHPGSPYSTGKF